MAMVLVSMRWAPTPSSSSKDELNWCEFARASSGHTKVVGWKGALMSVRRASMVKFPTRARQVSFMTRVCGAVVDEREVVPLHLKRMVRGSLEEDDK